MALGPGDELAVKVDRYEHGEAVAPFGSKEIHVLGNVIDHPDHQPPGSVIAVKVTEVEGDVIRAEFQGTEDHDPDADVPRRQKLVQKAANSGPSEAVKRKREMGRPAYLSPSEKEEIAERARERLEQAALEQGQERVREAVEQAETLADLRDAVDGEELETFVRQELADRSGEDAADVDERNLNHIIHRQNL